MCHGVNFPSCAEYWHIGDTWESMNFWACETREVKARTQILFWKVTPRIFKGLKIFGT
jgi:hypothetical protein